jgi:hypothetical protein
MGLYRGRGLPLLLLTLPLAACASAGGTSTDKPGTAVDLAPVRAALEEARRAGAPQNADDIFRQATVHLTDAEVLIAAGKLTAERALRLELLGKLAAAEARYAATLAQLDKRTAAASQATRNADSDLTARLRRSEEERRRLEQRIGLLQRDLELTETEVIRTKARLQGIETKAEASSAIAEARILMGRLDANDRATLGRCQELLSAAEQQINDNNFGAAVFFARKVQDIVTKPREPSPPAP